MSLAAVPLPYTYESVALKKIFKQMKFRRLTTAELEELQTDFVQFLVANTITAEDWEALKEKEPERAEGLVDIFSDLVFEKIIGNVKYLEYKTKADIKTFRCDADRILMKGLRIEGDTSLDLRQQNSPDAIMAELKISGAKAQIYAAEKGYKPDREAEVFRMLEGGALIDKAGHLFNALAELQH